MQGDSLGGTGAVITCAGFLALAVLELLRPARPSADGLAGRWFGNAALYLLSGLLFMLPLMTALTAASFAQASRIGLFDWLGLPPAIRVAIALLTLDLLVYAIHRTMHAVRPLWRLHAVHHSDPDLDAATTLRHHPVEAIITSVVLGATVFLLGISLTELAAYVLLEGLVQLAAHANVALPFRLDALLSRVLVTPGFHRLHHSSDAAQTDKNYGQVLTIWDRLFGTTCKAPPDCGIVFGLEQFREARFQLPHWLLAQPFLSRARQPTGTTRNRSVSPVA